MRKTALILVFTGINCLGTACRQGPQPSAPEGPPPLAEALGSAAAAGFEQALAPRPFAFPADHGPHPGFRNEWWYLTGNLDDAAGRRYGYELTLFRFRLQPSAPARTSRWATNQVYVGHFAVSDVAAGEFHVSERMARGALGLAGAAAEPLRVWLYDWTIQRRPRQDGSAAVWQLGASGDGASLALTLTATRSPVPHGDQGLSRKSAAPGNASYYYSVPRLATSGQLVIDGRPHEVDGLSWLDREWSSSALAAGQAGWDWFSLQLSDGSDLMFYRLRRRDGSTDPHSAGTFMPADAAARHVGHDALELDVLAHWESPAGASYPAAWRLRIAREDLELHIRPVLANQELDTWIRYWEGAVDVSGTRGGHAVDGRGYVELTGYAAGGGLPPR
ncbi:MAG TPA: lipocalin-like domain-containing protein [Woeseiaceae bacterium]|nr:lipocalin-like domain-containing protein [Woeseiaceae bacterium]